MSQQLSLFSDSTFEDQVFVEAFDSSEIENENEEDIVAQGHFDLSGMAVSGTDWTTGTIVNQIQKGRIILNPSFQRRDAWTKMAKSRFIESIFLGFPIPQIILAEHKSHKGNYIVIDGKQRLLSLMQFVLGEGNPPQKLKLSGLEILDKFNGLTYPELAHGEFSEYVEAFDNQPIRTVVIKNWPSVESLYVLFLRLNTGSVKLSPQELRQALYPGDFIDYLNRASSDSQMLRKILNISKPDFRMRDVEIMLRYLAFNYYIEDYSGSMQQFLDNTCKGLNECWSTNGLDVQEKIQDMENAMGASFEIFGNEHAFRKFKSGNYEGRYNRAVIDIMLYFFTNPEILEKSLEKRVEIKQTFQDLCTFDPQFLAAFESTTKSISSVVYRFRKWGEALSLILNTQIDLPLNDKIV